MADKKVSELSAITNLSGDDLLLVVNDPSGTPASRKVSLSNLFANVVSDVEYKGTVTHRANTTVRGTTMTVSANLVLGGTNVLNAINDRYSIANTDAKFVTNTDFQTVLANTNARIASGDDGNLVANSYLQTYISGLTALYVSNAVYQIEVSSLENRDIQTNNHVHATFTTNTVFQSVVANTNTRLNTLEANTDFQSNTFVTKNASAHEFIVTVGSKTATHPYQGGNTNAFYIDGVESPALHLVPNQTYSFNQTAPSNISNTLRFYRDATKTDEYTVGVTVSGSPGSTGNTVIAVSANTPQVLYYQCAEEDYMGAHASIASDSVFIRRVDDPATSNAVTEGVLAGDIFHSNTYLYVVTDSNTIQRVALSTF